MAAKDFSDCMRAFYSVSAAYYARPGDPHEVMIGMYHPGGGTSGEFAIRWHELGTLTRKISAPRLEVFDDGWAALAHFRDLLKWLASKDGKNITHDELVAQLKAMGLQDRTAYTRE